MSANQGPGRRLPVTIGPGMTAGTNDEVASASLVRETRPLESPEGVDLTLIRWCLSLTPLERLRALESSIRSLLALGRAPVSPRTIEERDQG